VLNEMCVFVLFFWFQFTLMVPNFYKYNVFTELIKMHSGIDL